MKFVSSENLSYIWGKIKSVFVPKTRKINNKTLDQDITLTAEDVGALPNTTVIPSTEGLASERYVDTKIANLVNSAPTTLDTLGELAAALQENEDVVETLDAAVSNKADKTTTDALTTRVTTAEGDIVELQAEIDTLDAKVPAIYVKSVNGSHGEVKDIATMSHMGRYDNNLRLVGVSASEEATTNTLDLSNGIYIKDLALKNDLGTQATFSLSGTTLTITPK